MFHVDLLNDQALPLEASHTHTYTDQNDFLCSGESQHESDYLTNPLQKGRGRREGNANGVAGDLKLTQSNLQMARSVLPFPPPNPCPR